ncbi:MAG TPA: hypothetical protein VL048_18555 [Xanthobacteraceae bacterium]|nr:hypothetical protein [Xanthobacteraceae bacterium]
MDQRLRQAWHARQRASPIYPVPYLAPEGLVLGAGTVLVPAEGTRRLASLDRQEVRVLALLSAAYGKAVAVEVLGNIARAADAWRQGDDCLAYIHLAHSRLPALQDSHEAARRLFLAEGFLEVGGNPRAVLEALNLDAAHIEAIEKVYNPAEPRVPAGSGRTSGQWTRVLSVLGDLSAEAAEQLESFALRLLSASLSEEAAAAVAFGLLFIPSPNKLSVEGEVDGLPGARYAWNRDENTLHLTYDNPDGGRTTFSAQLEDDVFRDERGQIIGRVLPDGTIAIDTAAVSADLARDDQPKLCPAPGLDRPGGSERGRDYEDYVKSVVNPDNPTPRGWGYQLPNPDQNGELVYFDDCQQSTGMMVEAKGNYAGVLSFEPSRTENSADWLKQSAAQLAAAGGRPIRWYFAEPETKAFAEELFRTAGGGRTRIETQVLPWPGSAP